MPTHHDLWAGIDLKLTNVQFHFDGMVKALRPRVPPPRNAVLYASTGAIVPDDWQQEFYTRLDAFLAGAYSIPEIVRCCFGHDTHHTLRKWFNDLGADERDRRGRFTQSEQFKTAYEQCRKSLLVAARHDSEHRIGFPRGLKATISERFGLMPYVGGRLNVCRQPKCTARQTMNLDGSQWRNHRLFNQSGQTSPSTANHCLMNFRIASPT